MSCCMLLPWVLRDVLRCPEMSKLSRLKQDDWTALESGLQCPASRSCTGALVPFDISDLPVVLITCLLVIRRSVEVSDHRL